MDCRIIQNYLGIGISGVGACKSHVYELSSNNRTRLWVSIMALVLGFSFLLASQIHLAYVFPS